MEKLPATIPEVEGPDRKALGGVGEVEQGKGAIYRFEQFQLSERVLLMRIRALMRSGLLLW